MKRVETQQRRSTASKESDASAVGLDRPQPHDVDAEFCLLGSILLKPDVCDEIATIVRSEDFFDQAHGRLFHLLMDMHNRNRAIDEKLVVARLRESGDLDALGGLAYLAKLATAVPHAAHASEYAQLIRNHALRRELIDAATVILKEAYTDESSAERADQSLGTADLRDL